MLSPKFLLGVGLGVAGYPSPCNPDLVCLILTFSSHVRKWFVNALLRHSCKSQPSCCHNGTCESGRSVLHLGFNP